jgi:hypothetical protein
LALLFLVGGAVLVWVGLQIRNNHQVFSNQWSAQGSAESFPAVPGRPQFEPNENRSKIPLFDHSHGYYDGPFQLVLSAAASQTEIWYTEDGSVPIPDDAFGGPNGMLYENPILIKQNAHITAVAVESGNQVSIPVTQTYLFMADILSQSPDTAERDGWPLQPANGKRMDYGMDPEIVAQFSSEAWLAVCRT